MRKVSDLSTFMMFWERASECNVSGGHGWASPVLSFFVMFETILSAVASWPVQSVYWCCDSKVQCPPQHRHNTNQLVLRGQKILWHIHEIFAMFGNNYGSHLLSQRSPTLSWHFGTAYWWQHRNYQGRHKTFQSIDFLDILPRPFTRAVRLIWEQNSQTKVNNPNDSLIQDIWRK